MPNWLWSIGMACALLIIGRDVLDTLRRVRKERHAVAWGSFWLAPAFLAFAAIISTMS